MEAKYYYLFQVIAVIVAWIVGVLIAYAAVKQDVAVVKAQQNDDRHYIEQRLDTIEQGQRDLNRKLDDYFRR